MKNQRFVSRLTQKATGKRRASGGARSVQGFVRDHLEEIGMARETLTWDEIAETLGEEGLAWGNGSPVTGKDLRSIFSRLVRTVDVAPRVKGRSSPAVTLSPSPTRQKPDATSEKDGDEGGRKGGFDPSRILEEMRKSTNERTGGVR